jgi:hypothetical protein
MIKEQKQQLVTVLTDAGFTNTDVLSKAFPKTAEEHEELSLNASNADATIYVCYSGRNWNDTKQQRLKPRGVPGGGLPELQFSLFIYSPQIDSNEEYDVEILTDKIAEVLFSNGYTLIADQASPVPTSNGDLYEIIMNVSISQRYNGGTV